MNDRPAIILRALTGATPADILPALERTEDGVWLSRTVWCGRYTLRGVPARLVDVLIEDADAGPWVVERSRKAGRYDGAERDRIALRRYNPGMGALQHLVELTISSEGAEAVVQVGTWTGRYPRLRDHLDPASGGLRRIVLWHATRYYSFLLDCGAKADVEALAAELDADPASLDLGLAEANRLVSRRLYQIARRAGWRKLTLREQRRLGLEGRQWWPETRIAEAYSATGCGEETLRAAAGTPTVEAWAAGTRAESGPSATLRGNGLAAGLARLLAVPEEP